MKSLFALMMLVFSTAHADYESPFAWHANLNQVYKCSDGTRPSLKEDGNYYTFKVDIPSRYDDSDASVLPPAYPYYFAFDARDEGLGGYMVSEYKKKIGTVSVLSMGNLLRLVYFQEEGKSQRAVVMCQALGPSR